MTTTGVDVFMRSMPAMAVCFMESEHLIFGSDDALENVRYDPIRFYVDTTHDSTPFGCGNGSEESLAEDEGFDLGEELLADNEVFLIDNNENNGEEFLVAAEVKKVVKEVSPRIVETEELKILILQQQEDAKGLVCSGSALIEPTRKKAKGYGKRSERKLRHTLPLQIQAQL